VRECASVWECLRGGGRSARRRRSEPSKAPLLCSLFIPYSRRGTPHVPPHTTQQHTPALPFNMTTAPMDTAAAEDAAAAAAAPASTPSAPGVPASVCVHPLVLLSVVDHYHRVARDTRKRVVGCLLGEVSRGRVDVTNSFAGERRREREAGRPRKQNEWGEARFDHSSLTPISSTHHQSPSRRTTRTPRSGSWTILTWRICTPCSRRSTVRGRAGERSGDGHPMQRSWARVCALSPDRPLSPPRRPTFGRPG